MIPISEIDSKIKNFQEATRIYATRGGELERIYALFIEELEELKQKAIPAVSEDRLVKELQEIYNLGNHWEAWLRLDKVIKDLKE